MIIMRQLFLLPIVVVLFSCSKKTSTGGGGGGGPVIPPVTVTPLITLPQGWKYNAGYTAGLPAGIQVFSYDSIFSGKQTRAFCLVYDSRTNRFEFKPALSATAKKPSTFFSEEAGITYACINGGFFGGNASYSLVKFNNAVLSPNIKAVNRTYNGTSTPYYPTRAAFGVSSTGSPLTAWVYSIGAGNDNIYSYPSPSPNVEGSAPQPVPDAAFPAGGAAWPAVSAIGGSPMLISGGNITITDVPELISINNTTSRPRSAIGANANGMVVLLAVEGDNAAAGYNGLNLSETATMLKDLGCTMAVNLDGGGSSSLVVANRLTVRPGDNGVERPVVSALLIKQK
jgi:hypothetical protein